MRIRRMLAVGALLALFGMVVVGVGTEMFMPRYARMAQTVGEVGAAFLAKSLSKVFFKETAPTAPTATYIGRRQATPVANPVTHAGPAGGTRWQPTPVKA